MRVLTSPILLASAVLVLVSSTRLYAGPCSNDIADLGRKLSDAPGLGPATTGTLAGSGPGTVKPASSPAMVSTAGTSADKQMGGTAGTKEMNAASAQVATSADDVRRQQEGLPTAAQVGMQNAGKSVETTPGQNGGAQPNARVSQAKMELERARGLDQKNDATCSDAVKKVRDLMGS